ncbi:MAG: hypothetical protein ABWK53_12245 [Anaerolineales bacterium]
MTYALDGGAWTPYTAPLTLGDGLHSLTFRAQDVAGHMAEASASVQVDTLPPQVSAALTGEQRNGWYLARVTFSLSASDDGSGVARLEYALDGGAWQTYTVPVTVGDGHHNLRLRAFDQAGNLAEGAPLTFRVDGTPPRVQVGQWYVWEGGRIRVVDGESGLTGVEVEIRDPQGRWPKVSQAWEVSDDDFETALTWDRRFSDGTLAPIGTYEVVVKAFDQAGNLARAVGHIIIPAPNVTPTPLPTATPLPTVTPTATAPAAFSAHSLPAAALPTFTPQVSTFVSRPPISQVSAPPSSPSSFIIHPSAFPLWGAAALTAIGAATGWALEAQRKRKEEEARQRAEAAAANARAAAREAEERRRQAEAAWRRKQEEAVREQAVEMPANLPPEAQQAFLHGGPGEQTAAQRRAAEQPAQEEKKPWWRRVGIIRDSMDSLQDGMDFIGGAVSTARASLRLAFPSRLGSPVWEEIAWNQFEAEVRRGVITDKNVLDELARLPNRNFRKLPINYTDLADAWDGAKRLGGAGVNLSPLALQLSGMTVEEHNPALARDLQASGGTLDGVLNVWQAGKQALGGARWLGDLLRSPWGKASVILQGFVGGIDYVTGASRLITDPSIVPGASEHAWVERVGVATQAIGGAFLVAGAVCAFVPTLQPAAPIFLTAGIAFEGVGMIMQNWGWLSEKAGQLFGKK